MKFWLSIFMLLLIQNSVLAQNKNVYNQIDSTLVRSTQNPFNGIVLITKKGQVQYSKIQGFSDLDNKTPLKLNDQFVIGSISKQFTSVLVLRELDKGNVNLFLPIRKYLPELSQPWADTVTIHHLLTHMHGITEIEKPTLFPVGTHFAYSQIGYDLLAKIVERTSGKTFAVLSKELFEKCGMKNTFHPDDKTYSNLVKGYTENDSIEYEKASFENFVAAGSFVSTVEDLNLWNQHLYEGNLLKRKTLKQLKTKQKDAVRDHPLFGITQYGYGITIDTKDNILQYGQTGFASGFISMNFYFPKTKSSVIVLENIAYQPNDLKQCFSIHLEVLKIVRKYQI